MNRKCENWIESFLELTKNTESPKQFWLWAGLFILGRVLDRNVCFEMSIGTIYTNLYVMFVAPPASRKGPPAKEAKKFLSKVGFKRSSDSPTVRAFLNHLNLAQQKNDKSSTHIISEEASSFLSHDAKKMIELLTDFFECPENSENIDTYSTSSAGKLILKKFFISLLILTTPKWIASNIPDEAFGGGLASRIITVTSRGREKFIALPPPFCSVLIGKLLHDLERIKEVKGKFKFHEDAIKKYKEWYNEFSENIINIPDERMHGFAGRFHVHVLKTAMLLSLSESNSLILKWKYIERAIELLQNVLKGLPLAFGDIGSNKITIELMKVRSQIMIAKEIFYSQLLIDNSRNLSSVELDLILKDLKKMKLIKIMKIGENKVIEWKGK
jgi:hypothetical protein